MELHEEIRRARLEMGLTQDDLAMLAKIQRRQISILENGGNITLNTLRRVIDALPNLEEFTFSKLRMKPEYFDMPPFELDQFRLVMFTLMTSIDELTKAFNRYLAVSDAEVKVDPEGVLERTQREMAEWTEKMSKALSIGLKAQAGKEREARRVRPRRKKGQQP